MQQHAKWIIRVLPATWQFSTTDSAEEVCSWMWRSIPCPEKINGFQTAHRIRNGQELPVTAFCMP